MSRQRAGRQRGLSLVELLVGIAIGMLVVVAALGSLLLTSGLAATVTELGQLQRQGAHALRMIGRQVRQAGARGLRTDASTGRHAVASDFAGVDATGLVVFGTDGANGPADEVSLSHQRALASPETPRDCLGAEVTTSQVDSTFQVAGQDLRCRTARMVQPMTGDVADFQLRYRVTTALGTRSMSATQVAAAGAWHAVTAVEVCLDLQGARRDSAASGSYRNCRRDGDGSIDSAPRDGRLHVVFRQLYAIRAGLGAP